MRSRIRIMITLIAIVIFLMPVSFILTFMLIPLWRWIEYEFGVESIGHSGPSEWCFYLIYILLLISCMMIYRIIRK